MKHNWQSFREKNYSNTEKSKIWLFNLLCLIIFGSYFIDSGLPKAVSFVLFGAIVIVGMNLARIIITLLLKIFFRDNVTSGVYSILIFLLILLLIVAGAFILPVPQLLILSILISFVEILFVKSLWSFFCCKRRSKPLILLLSTTVMLNLFMGAMLIGQGFQDGYIEEYLSFNRNQRDDTDSTDKMNLEQGKLAVSHLEYGEDASPGLALETTDLSPYIPDYKGITSMIRGIYWGYGIDEVPLKGKVWYPSEGGNYPVLFIIHGNHTMTTKSYLGYDYLGEYLSSYGYVVVSVDEAFCNAYIDFGLSNENDARAVLLLENMQLMERYNKNQASFLYQKMDFNNIALAGHSRGGESVATAALFNSYPVYPENGNITFDYNFKIKSLIAISPTFDQYQPAQHEVQVQNMNYLLIHGSNDQDVTNFMGYSQYHNVTYPEDNSYFKTYLYITGANHGQFNTQWGRYDLPYPFKPFLNTKNLMAPEEQRGILKIYTKTFLDTTLKKDIAGSRLFTDIEEYGKELPETIYINNYQDSSFDLLCGFDEDSNIKQGTKDEVNMESDHMVIWREVKTPIYQSVNDYVLQLEWKKTKEAYYLVNLPEHNAENGYLQFDIMDINKELEEEEIQPLDAVIILEDSHGNTSSVTMRDYATIYPPLPVKLFKLQFLTKFKDYKQCFQTVRLSSKEFEKNNEEFDSSSIVKIRFEFSENENGKIMIDNIGFGK
jgi:hypothetical protein